MKPNQRAFFKSQSEALASQANRVRQLIGDKHWYTDGAFKEAILLDAVRERLPSGMQARRGFVLAADLSEPSKEQDCLIFDRHAGVPVFEAVDFHMANPVGVVGLVSVKTKLGKEEFLDAGRGLVSALKIVRDEPSAGNPFLAIFCFDPDPQVKDETIVSWVREFVGEAAWPLRRRHMDGDQILGPLLVFTLNSRCIRIDHVDGRCRVRIYTLDDVGAALFLHMVELAAFESRAIDPLPGWALLDDASIGKLSHTEVL